MIRLLALLLLLLLGSAAPASASSPCEGSSCPAGWFRLDDATRKRAVDLADAYKQFMRSARSVTSTVAEARKRAEAAGFRAWDRKEPLAPFSRRYVVNRDRALVLFVTGERSDGMRIAVSHIDTPRLDLKAKPLKQAEGFAILQAIPYGGLLNYQWANQPLALVGRVSRKDGSSLDLAIGLRDDEPVFMIPSLSPHVDVDLRERKNREVLKGEEMQVLAGQMQNLTQLVEYLRATYQITPDDLVSAELNLVPAMAPRDLGFDRSMMAMYGQDDRFSAYASLHALFELQRPKRTAMVILANNEEANDVNNTGMQSTFFTNLIADLASDKGQGRGVVSASRVLSLDVNDGINPIWPNAWEANNAPRLGQGVNIKLYGKGHNPTSETLAWLRGVLDGANVPWQVASYKAERAGGATLGRELSRRDMDVIDLGAPVLSIHSTYDISSKADLWWLAQACKAFFDAP